MRPARQLTWNRTAALTSLVFLGSLALGICLRALGVFPSPALFGLTPYFYYLLVGAAPALLTLVLSARRRPTGSRLIRFVSSLILSLVFILYLAILNPSLYPKIECEKETRAGLFVHAECMCGTSDSDTQPVACSEDRPLFSPIMILHANP